MQCVWEPESCDLAAVRAVRPADGNFDAHSPASAPDRSARFAGHLPEVPEHSPVRQPVLRVLRVADRRASCRGAPPFTCRSPQGCASGAQTRRPGCPHGRRTGERETGARCHARNPR